MTMPNGTCFDCGAPAAHDHHVIPRSRGGTKTVPLCERCHGLVHNHDFTDHAVLTAAAMKAKADRGEFTGGEPPFGFRLSTDGVRLEQDPGEQDVIRIAKEWRARHASLRTVARALDARGFKSRNGRAFAASQIGRMVS